MNYHVRRPRNVEDGFDQVDPRVISGEEKFGKFTWSAIDSKEALWSFADEAKRDAFVKAYGGDKFDTTGYAGIGAPGGSYPLDPDCDFGYFTEWCCSMYLDPARPGFVMMPHTEKSCQLIPMKRQFSWDRE